MSYRRTEKFDVLYARELVMKDKDTNEPFLVYSTDETGQLKFRSIQGLPEFTQIQAKAHPQYLGDLQQAQLSYKFVGQTPDEDIVSASTQLPFSNDVEQSREAAIRRMHNMDVITSEDGEEIVVSFQYADKICFYQRELAHQSNDNAMNIPLYDVEDMLASQGKDGDSSGIERRDPIDTFVQSHAPLQYIDEASNVQYSESDDVYGGSRIAMSGNGKVLVVGNPEFGIESMDKCTGLSTSVSTEVGNIDIYIRNTDGGFTNDRKLETVIRITEDSIYNVSYQRIGKYVATNYDASIIIATNDVNTSQTQGSVDHAIFVIWRNYNREEELEEGSTEESYAYDIVQRIALEDVMRTMGRGDQYAIEDTKILSVSLTRGGEHLFVYIVHDDTNVPMLLVFQQDRNEYVFRYAQDMNALMSSTGITIRDTVDLTKDLSQLSMDTYAHQAVIRVTDVSNDDEVDKIVVMRRFGYYFQPTFTFVPPQKDDGSYQTITSDITISSLGTHIIFATEDGTIYVLSNSDDGWQIQYAIPISRFQMEDATGKLVRESRTSYNKTTGEYVTTETGDPLLLLDGQTPDAGRSLLYDDEDGSLQHMIGMKLALSSGGRRIISMNYKEVVDEDDSNQHIYIPQLFTFSGRPNLYFSGGNVGINEPTPAFDLDVNSDMRVQNDLCVDHNVTVGNDLRVTSQATIHNTLRVVGGATLEDIIDVSSHATLHDSLQVHSNITGDGTLNIYQHGTFHDSLYTESNSTVGNHLFVSGCTTLNGILDVSGDATVHSSIVVYETSDLSGNVTAHSNLYVQEDTFIFGDATVENTLDVSGMITTHDSLRVGTDATIGGSLCVDERTMLFNTLDVSSNATFHENVRVHSNTTLDGILDVSNNTTFHSDVRAHSSLIVDGQSTIDNTLHVTDKVMAASDVCISGNQIVDGTSVIYGSQTIGTDVSPITLDAYGNVTVRGEDSVLYNEGSLVNAKSAEVMGKTTLHNDTFVDGNLVIHSVDYGSHELVVEGKTRIDESLHVGEDIIVDDNATFHNDVRVERELHVGDSAHIEQTFQVSNDFAVQSGQVLIGSNDDTSQVTVRGPTTLTGPSLHIDASTTQHGPLHVSQTTTLGDDTDVYGNVTIHGDSTQDTTLYIEGEQVVEGRVTIEGELVVENTVHTTNTVHAQTLHVTSHTTLDAQLCVKDTVIAEKDVLIQQSLGVEGSADISGEVNVHGNARFETNVTVGENLTVSQNIQTNTQTVTQRLISTTETQLHEVTINGDTQITNNSGTDLLFSVDTSNNIIHTGATITLNHNANGEGFTVQPDGTIVGSAENDPNNPADQTIRPQMLLDHTTGGVKAKDIKIYDSTYEGVADVDAIFTVNKDGLSGSKSVSIGNGSDTILLQPKTRPENGYSADDVSFVQAPRVQIADKPLVSRLGEKTVNGINNIVPFLFRDTIDEDIPMGPDESYVNAEENISICGTQITLFRGGVSKTGYKEEIVEHEMEQGIIMDSVQGNIIASGDIIAENIATRGTITCGELDVSVLKATTTIQATMELSYDQLDVTNYVNSKTFNASEQINAPDIQVTGVMEVTGDATMHDNLHVSTIHGISSTEPLHVDGKLAIDDSTFVFADKELTVTDGEIAVKKDFTVTNITELSRFAFTHSITDNAGDDTANNKMELSGHLQAKTSTNGAGYLPMFSLSMSQDNVSSTVFDPAKTSMRIGMEAQDTISKNDFAFYGGNLNPSSFSTTDNTFKIARANTHLYNTNFRQERDPSLGPLLSTEFILGVPTNKGTFRVEAANASFESTDISIPTDSSLLVGTRTGNHIMLDGDDSTLEVMNNNTPLYRLVPESDDTSDFKILFGTDPTNRIDYKESTRAMTYHGKHSFADTVTFDGVIDANQLQVNRITSLESSTVTFEKGIEIQNTGIGNSLEVTGDTVFNNDVVINGTVTFMQAPNFQSSTYDNLEIDDRLTAQKTETNTVITEQIKLRDTPGGNGIAMATMSVNSDNIGKFKIDATLLESNSNVFQNIRASDASDALELLQFNANHTAIPQEMRLTGANGALSIMGQGSSGIVHTMVSHDLVNGVVIPVLGETDKVIKCKSRVTFDGKIYTRAGIDVDEISTSLYTVQHTLANGTLEEIGSTRSHKDGFIDAVEIRSDSGAGNDTSAASVFIGKNGSSGFVHIGTECTSASHGTTVPVQAGSFATHDTTADYNVVLDSSGVRVLTTSLSVTESTENATKLLTFDKSAGDAVMNQTTQFPAGIKVPLQSINTQDTHNRSLQDVLENEIHGTLTLHDVPAAAPNTSNTYLPAHARVEWSLDTTQTSNIGFWYDSVLRTLDGNATIDEFLINDSQSITIIDGSTIPPHYYLQPGWRQNNNVNRVDFVLLHTHGVIRIPIGSKTRNVYYVWNTGQALQEGKSKSIAFQTIDNIPTFYCMMNQYDTSSTDSNDQNALRIEAVQLSFGSRDGTRKDFNASNLDSVNQTPLILFVKNHDGTTGKTKENTSIFFGGQTAQDGFHNFFERTIIPATYPVEFTSSMGELVTSDGITLTPNIVFEEETENRLFQNKISNNGIFKSSWSYKEFNGTASANSLESSSMYTTVFTSETSISPVYNGSSLFSTNNIVLNQVAVLPFAMYPDAKLVTPTRFGSIPIYRTQTTETTEFMTLNFDVFGVIYGLSPSRNTLYIHNTTADYAQRSILPTNNPFVPDVTELSFYTCNDSFQSSDGSNSFSLREAGSGGSQDATHLVDLTSTRIMARQHFPSIRLPRNRFVFIDMHDMFMSTYMTLTNKYRDTSNTDDVYEYVQFIEQFNKGSSVSSNILIMTRNSMDIDYVASNSYSFYVKSGDSITYGSPLTNDAYQPSTTMVPIADTNNTYILPIHPDYAISNTIVQYDSDSSTATGNLYHNGYGDNYGTPSSTDADVPFTSLDATEGKGIIQSSTTFGAFRISVAEQVFQNAMYTSGTLIIPSITNVLDETVLPTVDKLQWTIEVTYHLAPQSGSGIDVEQLYSITQYYGEEGNNDNLFSNILFSTDSTSVPSYDGDAIKTGEFKDGITYKLQTDSSVNGELKFLIPRFDLLNSYANYHLDAITCYVSLTYLDDSKPIFFSKPTVTLHRDLTNDARHSVTDTQIVRLRPDPSSTFFTQTQCVQKVYETNDLQSGTAYNFVRINVTSTDVETVVLTNATITLSAFGGRDQISSTYGDSFVTGQYMVTFLTITNKESNNTYNYKVVPRQFITLQHVAPQDLISKGILDFHEDLYMNGDVNSGEFIDETTLETTGNATELLTYKLMTNNQFIGSVKRETVTVRIESIHQLLTGTIPHSVSFHEFPSA